MLFRVKPEMTVGVGHVRSIPKSGRQMRQTFRHILTKQREASIFAVS
jgi:hypothetical protein